MEQDFYVGRLRDRHGLEVLVPDAADRRIVHDVIYDELCVGVVDDGSRDEYRRIMRGLAERGAEAILLGCTEIDLLVGPGGLARARVRHHAPARRARGRAGDRRLQPAGRMTVTPGPAPSLIATSASGTSSSPISRVTRSPGRSRPAWTSASISG